MDICSQRGKHIFKDNTTYLLAIPLSRKCLGYAIPVSVSDYVNLRTLFRIHSQTFTLKAHLFSLFAVFPNTTRVRRMFGI